MLYHLDMNHHQLIYNIVMSIDSECTKCFMQDAVNQMYNFFFSRSLYNTFASPWADTPCRPEDIGKIIVDATYIAL